MIGYLSPNNLFDFTRPELGVLSVCRLIRAVAMRNNCATVFYQDLSTLCHRSNRCTPVLSAVLLPLKDYGLRDCWPKNLVFIFRAHISIFAYGTVNLENFFFRSQSVEVALETTQYH